MTNNLKILSKLHTTDCVKGKKGKFRAVVKLKSGFISIVDHKNYWESSYDVFMSFENGTLKTIQFQPENTEYWLTTFAISGKKIITIDVDILSKVTIGDINSLWFNTELYSNEQYMLVNAKNSKHKVFVNNEQ